MVAFGNNIWKTMFEANGTSMRDEKAFLEIVPKSRHTGHTINSIMSAAIHDCVFILDVCV